MRTRIVFVLILFIISINLSNSQGKATFTPEKPKIGDVITIKYDPSGSKLDTAKEISAELFMVKEIEDPLWQEVKLSKKAGKWTGEFLINEKDTRLLLIRFVSDKIIDNNNKNVWDVLIYGRNNEPLYSAYDYRGMLYAQGDNYEYSPFGFYKKKDFDKAVSDFERESKLYPNSWRGKITLWNIWRKENPDDQTKDKIKSAIDEVYEKNKNDEVALWEITSLYEKLGQKEKSDKIINDAIAKNPKGIIARKNDFRNAYKEKDRSKGSMQFEKIITTYDHKNYEKKFILIYLGEVYSKKKDWNKIENIIASIMPKDGRMICYPASEMIEDSTMIEKGIDYAKRASELLINPSLEMKEPYMSISDYKAECNFYYYYIKHKIATGLIKLFKYAEAEKILKEIYVAETKNKAKYAEALVDCYIKSGKNEKAFNLSREVIAKYGATEGIVNNFKTAYTKVKGSDTDFDATLSDLKNSAKKSLKEKLMKELVHTPAPQFELKGLDGKAVKLSDLRGKIVVIDFWATWCGPCVASFPFLQKVYEKYKSNPDIVILALDMKESKKGEEKEKLVKKITENKCYGFTVLFDENTWEKYDVTEIPTKFIIDKEGFIQFKTIGFSGGDKMMDEMDIQFDILLKGEHKK